MTGMTAGQRGQRAGETELGQRARALSIRRLGDGRRVARARGTGVTAHAAELTRVDDKRRAAEILHAADVELAGRRRGHERGDEPCRHGCP